MKNNKIEKNDLQKALDECKQAFIAAFLFSLAVNILMVISPLYTLQVLDRVIGSGSMQTLLGLALLFGTIHFTYGLLQIVRSFTLIKIGEWLDKKLSPLLFSHSVSSAAEKQKMSSSQILRDFQSFKTFLTSAGINTIFDAPWSILYIIAIFMINKYIGFLTIGMGVLLVVIALFNAVITNRTLAESSEFSIKSMYQAEISNRNAETVEAMGMMKNVSSNWHYYNQEALKKQTLASNRNGIISNIARFLRNLMQLAVTGIGAYFVVTTGGMDMTTGGMIASSILVGRALAPFDNAIEIWKRISEATRSYTRINNALNVKSLRTDSMPIPSVEGKISIENLYFTIADSVRPGEVPPYILQDISLVINPGEQVAVIGHSAAGKSTLARLLMGVWGPSSGMIKLDEGNVYNWNRENFGKFVGYVPQNIELFSGTIKENIARMENIDNINPDLVIKAAKIAGAHEIIMNLPKGYDTDIGFGGSNLSGGQKQRVALARAFYNNPKFIVLDEPNANLDEAGEQSLKNAIIQSKNNSTTAIIISHRPSILSVVDKILVLSKGKILHWGTKEEVLKEVSTTRHGSIHIN